jgi:protein-disulfide isomerase
VAQRQRKGPPPKEAGGNNTIFYIVLGVIALGGILAIAYALSGAGSGSAATEMVDLEAMEVRELYERATPMRLGARDAPVTIVEFGDFQCPGCATFSLSTRPVIEDRYVDSGKVQIVYYDFPLVSIHAHAFLAARASRCAAEQQLPGVPADSAAAANAAYWVYHDKLFQEQGNWSWKQSVVDDFVSYAGAVGLDEGQFGRCLRSDRYADVVTANRLLGDRLTITQTPTVIVNNRRIPSPNPLALSEAIEQALGNQ